VSKRGVTKGSERNPALLCQHVSENGRRCHAYKRRDSDFCNPHSVTPLEWSRKGHIGRARKAQAEDEIFNRWTDSWRTWQPDTLKRVFQVIADLLEARYDGLGTPDNELRALGVELALRFFHPPPVDDDEALGPARARLLHSYREGKLDIRGLPPELFGLEDDPKDENAEGSSGARIASELHAGRVS
jgi:hypothetical protein